MSVHHLVNIYATAQVQSEHSDGSIDQVFRCILKVQNNSRFAFDKLRTINLDYICVLSVTLSE